MSYPKCILSLANLKAAGGGMLNCLIFMQWEIILSLFIKGKKGWATCVS